jgi:hypothetical protein
LAAARPSIARRRAAAHMKYEIVLDMITPRKGTHFRDEGVRETV